MTASATHDATSVADLASAALSITADQNRLAHALADTMACAIGAERVGGPALAAIAAYAQTEAELPCATVWATGERVGRRAAALRNGVAARYLDLNDTYVSRAVVHPSDLWAVVVAEAEAGGHTWSETFAAAGVGYEVLCQAADRARLADRGFEASSLMPVAAALAISHLLGLSAEEAGHAAAIAGLDAGTLRVARSGRLSHWKAVAAAWGALKGWSAARLAAAGVRGPENAFTSEDGLFARVTGDWSIEPGPATHLDRVLTKRYPVQIFIQRPVDLAIALRSQISGIALEDIDSVVVTTFRQATRMAGAPAHMGMATESADHSTAFAVAVALATGELAPDAIHERIGDERVMRLAGRVVLEESPAYTDRYPGELPAAIDIHTSSGSSFRRSSDDDEEHGTGRSASEKVRRLIGSERRSWPIELPGQVPDVEVFGPGQGDRR